MRLLPCAMVLLGFVGVGVAEPAPITFRIKGQVLLGTKPILELTAAVPVTDVRVELDRDTGPHVTLHPGKLGKGQVVSLAIGDGAAGAASYKGTISASITGGAAWSNPLSFDTVVLAPIKVTYDAEHLDLDQHQLQFQVSRAIAQADVVVFGEDGKELGKGSASFASPTTPLAWLAVTWTQSASTRVATMKLRVAATDGMATNVELVPWSVAIDHEDVNFDTDSAAIDPGETAKLDASLVKIAETVKRVSFVKMQLYVAGHTDTVGPNDKNKKLSNLRALAIARYFRKKGLAIPIAFAGYGEEVPRVKTPDDTDERANRRADYVLAPAGGLPPFKGAYAKARVTWAQIK